MKLIAVKFGYKWKMLASTSMVSNSMAYRSLDINGKCGQNLSGNCISLYAFGTKVLLFRCFITISICFFMSYNSRFTVMRQLQLKCLKPSRKTGA